MMVVIMSVGTLADIVSQRSADVRWPWDSLWWRGVVTETPRQTAKTWRLILTLDDDNHNKVVVSVFKNAIDDVPQAGDVVAFTASMRRPYNFGNSEFDYARWLRRQGFTGMAFTYDEIVVLQGVERQRVIDNLSAWTRLKLWAQRMRARLIGRYAALNIDEQQLSVLSAITLGDKSGLTKQTRTAFSDSGASHVLALSGLHLGIVVCFLMGTLGFLRRRSWGRVLLSMLCIFVVAAFVLLTGCSVSVMRAGIMVTMVVILGLHGDGQLSVNNVTLAALILLINPSSLFDLGFQLSFLAVFALVCLSPYYQRSRWRQKAGRLGWVLDFIFISVVAQLATAPLVAYTFGRLPLLFLLTNMIAIPCVYVILIAGIAYLLLSWAPLLGPALAWVLKIVLTIMLNGIDAIASLPMASLQLE